MENDSNGHSADSNGSNGSGAHRNRRSKNLKLDPDRFIPWTDDLPAQKRAPGISRPRRKIAPSPIFPSILQIGLIFLLGGALFGWLFSVDSPLQQRQETPDLSDSPEPFRIAVNRAIAAAELTQTAQSQEEWLAVTAWWHSAVRSMQQVPSGNEFYELAQQKAIEYQQNRDYAQSEFQAAPPSLPHTSLWRVGSSRSQVIHLEGEPKRAIAYDHLCQEVLYYDDSQVDLLNGIVVEIQDQDGKFFTAVQSVPDLSLALNQSAWSLGDSREVVFAVQGTPTRVERYEVTEQEQLYYGDSVIYLAGNQVIGYSNLDRNLRISVAPFTFPTQQNAAWSLNSSRPDILRLQGTPTQIIRDRYNCTETFYYDNNTIVLKNGRVHSYNNADGQLQVAAN